MATIKFDSLEGLNKRDYSSSHVDIKSAKRLEIKPKGGTAVITTDFTVHMGDDEIGLIQQQHGLGSKYLLSLASTAVKSGHVGKLTITLINHGDVMAEVFPGEAVAQLLIMKAGKLEIEQ